jgi:8-oxo-dGTP pyrophosphatase MutT (NUDIX family)
VNWLRTGIVNHPALRTVPTWLHPVADSARTLDVQSWTRFVPPDGQGTAAAVLLLFGEGPDILLTERAADLRAHGGQPAFPGGVVEPTDASHVSAALREAHEETGVQPGGIQVFGQLPDLWLPVSNYAVRPVLAWWRDPSEVGISAEVTSAHRVPIEELVDPANRCRVQHPSGYVGPGFKVRGLLVWGFTGGLLSMVLESAGWAVPWDTSRVIPLGDAP